MNNSTSNLEKLVNEPYKYGFATEIETDTIKKGLSEEIVRLISAKKNEPEFMLDFRLKAFKKWQKMKEPEWSYLNYESTNYQDIRYYSAPKTKKKLNSLDEVDPELLEAFEKLGISLNEQKRISHVAVDAVFDSVSIATTYKEKLAKSGVIFCSISEAIEHYPNLIEKFLGTVISSGDNFFASLKYSI